MSSAWTTVAAVAALCFALRAAGPLVLRRRALPPRLSRRLDAATPAVLASLVAVLLLGRGGGVGVDARSAGTAAAAAAFAWRRSLLLAAAVAAGVTGAIRLL